VSNISPASGPGHYLLWPLGNALIIAVLVYQLVLVSRCIVFFKLCEQALQMESVAFNSVATSVKAEYAVFTLDCDPTTSDRVEERRDRERPALQ